MSVLWTIAITMAAMVTTTAMRFIARIIVL